MNEELISQVPLFASLPPSEIQYLAETLEPVLVPEGEVLLTEGEFSNRLYILLEGQVEILKAYGTPDERVLAIRGGNVCLGEMSLFTKDKVHTASVRAHTPLSVLEMSHEEFDALLHRQPSIAYTLVEMLSKRLDASEDLTIRDLRRKNRELMKAYKELEAAQAQLVEQERLKRELEVARQIQESILPRRLPQIPGFDFGALIEPMTAVGGDFYDFLHINDETIAIAIGDVSDHGVHAALFMALAATLLQAEAQRSNSPCEVLTHVNYHLLDMNEAGMFVTLLYGLLNTKSLDFHYARAGHEIPTIMDNKGRFLKLEQRRGQPLGLFSDVTIEENRISLPQESLLLMYTDGVKEAMDAEGNMFGIDLLHEVLKEEGHRSAQDICDHLWDALEAHRAGIDRGDDTTLVAIRIG
jgi:sigma-B regulation protein RsbU (phosphoserine phosphatase)